MPVRYTTKQIPVPSTDAPGMNDALRAYFTYEVDDYAENVRNGNIDPSDGYHPTLGGAIDSLQQAPGEMVEGWLGEDDNGETSIDTLMANLLALATSSASTDTTPASSTSSPNHPETARRLAYGATNRTTRMPHNPNPSTPEERLLRAIFGDTAPEPVTTPPVDIVAEANRVLLAADLDAVLAALGYTAAQNDELRRLILDAEVVNGSWLQTDDGIRARSDVMAALRARRGLKAS